MSHDEVSKYTEFLVVFSGGVYIEHRLWRQQQHRGYTAPRDPRNVYPPDLTRRS